MTQRKGIEALPEHIRAKIVIDPVTGCWNWTAPLTFGYGRIWIKGVMGRSHRVVYQLLVGAISDELVCDHLCRNRACANPAHIEIVTQRENLLRGNGAAAVAARRTCCPKCGGPYVVVKDGDGTRRQCSPCHREREHEKQFRRRSRRRAIANAKVK